ncbi:MAG TPA: helix-turn-helix domain-containing protein [Marmoricola sp.]
MAEAGVLAPRQGLNARQAETVERLLAAGEAELDEVGPEALTVRTVAHRAGVSPATAYTYLASKNHLFAELFWRRLVTEPGPEPSGADRVERLRVVTRHMARMLAASPHLATAANIALLGSDPEVERLRLVIGAEFVRRFRAAIGEPADPRVLEALTFAFSGALLQAGMGLVTYDELSDRLDDVVAVIMEGAR